MKKEHIDALRDAANAAVAEALYDAAEWAGGLTTAGKLEAERARGVEAADTFRDGYGAACFAIYEALKERADKIE